MQKSKCFLKKDAPGQRFCRGVKEPALHPIDPGLNPWHLILSSRATTGVTLEHRAKTYAPYSTTQSEKLAF